MGETAPVLLRDLNAPLTVRDRFEAVRAALELAVAPEGWADRTSRRCSRSSPRTTRASARRPSVSRAASSPCSGKRAPGVDPQPEIGRYLADGTLERHSSGSRDRVRPLSLLPSNPVSARAPQYVFVTGGVVSALGKGIVAASLGRLLKARGLKVQVQKFDPYLNVDPGTMSPFQHGEVFVTEDGAETDLDIGHYERFIDENLSRDVEPHRGRVWQTR